MWKRVVVCVIALALTASAPVAAAGERTVEGTISKIDHEAGTLSVTDGMGVGWNYRVLPGAGIDLSAFKEGDSVTVSISRATPLNMMSAADYVRKGDTITRAAGNPSSLPPWVGR